MANVAKSKTMITQMGAIQTCMSEEAFSRRSNGEGITNQEHLLRHIPYPYYGVEVTAGL